MPLAGFCTPGVAAYDLWTGAAAADETPGPVNWTQPYFDCGRSNKWIMGAAVPIVDLYHRHTGFRHIEYPT